MASSLEAAIQDADAIVFLVKHTEFVNLNPAEIATTDEGTRDIGLCQWLAGAALERAQALKYFDWE